jgi:uncharacterized protein (UPF0332 family)
MDFNWERYLDVSKKIKNLMTSTPKDSELAEAFFRTSASRAYYAIYHLALEFAKDNLGYDDRRDRREGEGSHQRLRNYYLGFDNEDYKKLSKLLSKMHQYRKACDYDKAINYPRGLMDASIKSADDALIIFINNNLSG